MVVVRYPYVKAYSADIGSGGGFDQTDTTTNTVNACTPSTQTGIFAYMRPRTQHNNTATGRSGSGGQINAYAWGNAPPPQNGDISGFATAERRTTATSISNLAFGSIAPASITDTNQADIGGNLSGEAPCMPDYFYQTQYPTDSPITEDYLSTNINQGQLISNNGKQLIRNGNLSTNPIPNFQGRVTLYVKGDLYIDRDITYKSYTTVAEIPNLTFVVLGNIYINPGVTTLDGTYIAQPLANGTKGRIYTCATGLGSQITSAITVYSTCSGGYGGVPGDAGFGKLTFNGSVIAQKVILNRAVNTLSNSRFKETASDSQGAEIFNFSPEIYLSPPIFKPTSTITSGDYDAIAILPPIL